MYMVFCCQWGDGNSFLDEGVTQLKACSGLQMFKESQVFDISV